MSSAHPSCDRPGGHVCQRPSGRVCVEPGCELTAGTLWGPNWCPEHDAERIERVSAGLDEARERFRRRES